VNKGFTIAVCQPKCYWWSRIRRCTVLRCRQVRRCPPSAGLAQAPSRSAVWTTRTGWRERRSADSTVSCSTAGRRNWG